MFMAVTFGDIMFPLWPFAIIFLTILAFNMHRKGCSKIYILFNIIFCIYLIFAANEAFFPIYLSGDFADAMRRDSPNPQVNLTPFYFGLYPNYRLVLILSLENIILTVPFGFGLNFIARVKLIQIPLIALLLGLGLEGTQYLLSVLLGYSYRVVDINDVILNTIGVLFGYGLFRIFAWLYVVVTGKYEIDHKGVSAYIYNICMSVRN